MLEAIIASGIIVTAVTSSLTLVTAAVGAEKESEAGIIGAGLAREGIEVVRSIRDTNWLTDAPWDAGLEGASNDYDGVPVFAPETNSWSVLFTPADINASEAEVRRYTTADTPQEAVGLWVQAATPPARTAATVYRRIVYLYPICDNDLSTPKTTGNCSPNVKVGIQVISQVQWRTSGRVRNLRMEERIFDWR